MSHPSRGSGAHGVSWLCLPAAGGLWKSGSSRPAPATGTKGHHCWASEAALCQGHCSGRGKLSQREPFVLAHGCGDEWKSMRLFILIKSRGHLRRNRLSEKGTSKGKCVVRKFMDFSICKAEVCSLFMFVLLLKLFMGCFKNPQKSSHGSGIICVLITQLNLSSWLIGQSLEPRGQLLSWLTATWLHPTQHWEQTNSLFIQWTQTVQVNSSMGIVFVKWGYLGTWEKKTSRS